MAEGVETGAELALLLPLGCQVVQGYLFSRPMSGQAVAGYLLAERAGGVAFSQTVRSAG